MHIVVLLLARNANKKSESIAIILLLLIVFSVFITKKCTSFSLTLSGQGKNYLCTNSLYM